MILDLSEEALEYGLQASRAIEAAGGDELVQAAEADPRRRSEVADGVLAGLGAWDLDPAGSADELEAAAALCRASGYWAVPYPVAERMSRPADLDVDGLLVVGPQPAAPVAGLDLRWAAVDLAGRRSTVTVGSASANMRKTAFVVPIGLVPLDEGGASALALAVTLPCWYLVGLMDRAVALTRAYVREREQFGQPLAAFQGVQFQLTDAEVERVGVEELAKYALWSVQTGRPEALDDALALRLAALEAADIVFRVTHQLHGAIGFCDETTLSWLSRYSVPGRRLPLNLTATRQALTERLGGRGLTGLFGPSA